MSRTVALLLVFTACCYASIWSAGFVYEDAHNLARATDPNGAGSVSSLQIPGRMGSLWIFLIAEKVGGVRLQHVLSLALHLLNGWLLYRLALVLTGDEATAVVAAGLFLLHPIQVEAVAYVAARNDVLVTTGILVSCLAALSRRWLFAGLGTAFALVCKESGVVGLLLIPLVLLTGTRERRWWWRALPAVVALGAGFAYGRVVDIVGDPYVWAGPTRLLSTVSLWRMVGLVVIPIGFSVEHDYVGVPVSVLLASAAATVALVPLAWVCRKREPIIAFGLAWVLLALLPRFVFPLPEPLNEHQTYTAFVGLWLVLGRIMRYSVES